MKRCLTLFTLLLVLLGVAGRGQEATEKPHLEFVRALRDKGYNDLAFDYLEKMAKTGPASFKAFIPLEMARVRMDKADREGNLGARSAEYAKARQEFLDFVKNRPNDPLAAEAQLEAARILQLEGRSLLRQGLKLEEAEQVPLVKKASEKFKQARTELDKASQALDAALAKEPRLKQARGLARLEQQRNELDLASTYDPLNLSLAEAGKIVNEAIKELTAYAATDPKDPFANNARAWTGKAYLQIDNPAKAKESFDAVMKLAGPEAEEAKRLTRFFLFLQAMDERKPAPAEQAQGLGEEWLKAYPNFHSTPEGAQLRNQLANSYLKSAQALHKPPAQPSLASKALYDKALKMFQSLETPENEYSEEASAQKVKIVLATNVGSTNIKDLKEFSPTFIAAQATAQKMAEAETKMWRAKYAKDQTPKQKEEAEKLEKNWPVEKKQFLTQIRDLLNHAKSLADDKTPPAELAECYANLVYVYAALGEPEKGAVIGEYAARNIRSPKAAAAAAYTLQAYSQMISEGEGVIDPKWVKTDEDRLLKLAQHMEQAWPNDTNTDAARHQVGVLMLRQRRAKEAAQVLARVSSNYKPAASLTDARWWWAVAAQQMLSEPNIDDKEKKSYQDQVRIALEGVPEVPTNVTPEVAQMYIQAKIQLCNALFEAKKFDDLDKQATLLKKKMAAFDLPASVRDRLQPTIDTLAVYAQFGRASNFLNTNQVDKAEKLCDEVVPAFTAQLDKTRAAIMKTKAEYDAALDKQKAENAKHELDRLVMQYTREAGLLRAFLSVAIRANVQTGNIARAQQLLARLRQLASEKIMIKDEDGKDKELVLSNVGAQVYVHLVAQLKEQIDELQAAGKQKELAALMKNFNAFLESMTKQQPAPEVIFFIANAYRELKKYNESANILDKLVDPGAKDEKGQEAYRAGKLMQAQLYRLAKNYDQAGKIIAKIESEGWGKIQIMKEKAYFYQDQEKWGGAAVSWRNMMERLAPSLQQPRVKEQYYECYYNYITCLYKFAATLTDPKLSAAELAKKKQEYIERAAKLIIKVEEAEPASMGAPGLKEQYQKFLADNPPLKREYDKAKAAPAAAAGGN